MSEEYYIRQDEFCIYIADKVNPARKKAGLPEIGDSEARACFRVMEEFSKKWNDPEYREKWDESKCTDQSSYPLAL